MGDVASTNGLSNAGKRSRGSGSRNLGTAWGMEGAEGRVVIEGGDNQSWWVRKVMMKKTRVAVEFVMGVASSASSQGVVPHRDLGREAS